MSRKKAHIYTFTIIHVGSVEFFERIPYLVAVVEDNHSRFLTRIEGFTDDIDVQIGMEVEFFKNDEKGRPIYSFIKK